MSDSQNKKNEQQNNLCTTLTEQWKKGELKEGVYYCNIGNTVETLFTWGKNYHQLTNNKDEVYIPEMDDCEVLAPVPTYEEWQEKQKSLKVLAEAYCKEKEENQLLKKLLKDCKEKLKYCTRETYELQTKIDEVLK